MLPVDLLATAERVSTLGVIPRAQICKSLLSGQRSRLHGRGLLVSCRCKASAERLELQPPWSCCGGGDVESGSSQTWEQQGSKKLPVVTEYQ